MGMDNKIQPKIDTNEADVQSIDTELIGIVYEVAFDPNFWPDLMESITCLFDNKHDGEQQRLEKSDHDSEQVQLFAQQMEKGEAQHLATLLPHLYRALKLKRVYNKADQTRGQAQAILDQFPIGVMLVNGSGSLVTANQHAVDILADGNALTLNRGVLCTLMAQQDLQLKDLINKAANTPLENADAQIWTLKIEPSNNQAPISLLISPDPYPNTHYDSRVEGCAAIFVAAASSQHKIAESALQTLFNLSPAEARLAALLASGESLIQAAEHSYISRNTAKVQLKSIFTKMGVSRQAELIKRILTSPAVFQPSPTKPSEPCSHTAAILHSCINREAHITLRDGRRLQFAEFGDPKGKPVIHLHGILGCRYERWPDDDLTKSLGVRLIIPDRPGYGCSEHVLEHNYLDFADDLIELIDYLDVPRCSMMGLSIGAIYGCAFAYKAPDRLRNIAMVSSSPPFRCFADFSGMPPSLRLLIAFSKYMPTAARITTEIAINNACKNPEKFLANIPVGSADRAVFSNILLKKHIENCVLSGNKLRHTGFVQDILMAAEPWPFSVAEVTTKIDFWHGTDDLHCPINRIMPIIESVPNKRLHIIEDGGHFLIYKHWQEILHTL